MEGPVMRFGHQGGLSLPLYYKFILSLSVVLALACIGYGIYSYRHNVSVENTRKALVELQNSGNASNRKDLEDIFINAPKDMKTAIALDMGNIAIQEGKYEEAKDSYSLVADSSDTIHLVGILGEVQALLELKQIQEAITILEELEKNLPTYLQSAVLFTLAQAQEEINLKDAALKSYMKLLVLDVENKNYIQYRIQKLVSS